MGKKRECGIVVFGSDNV